jgi:hypothetical protein
LGIQILLQKRIDHHFQPLYILYKNLSFCDGIVGPGSGSAWIRIALSFWI